jgi:hypothetical protein
LRITSSRQSLFRMEPRAPLADTGVVSFPLRTSDEIPGLLLYPLFIEKRFRLPFFVHYFVL